MKYDVVILGSGESGMGAAHLAASKNQRALLSDRGIIAPENKQVLRSLKIDFEEGAHGPDVFNTQLMVKSPGITDAASIVQDALTKGIEVISELEYGYRYVKKGAQIIAITGTNGKTTTTLLTYHLMKTAGMDVALAGNVGYSFAKRVSEKPYEYYVLEVSSFQLDNISAFKPNVSILLNITPDHLDRYNHQFENYVSSKFRITENLSKEEVFIYCSDSIPVEKAIAKRKIEACLFAVSATKRVEQGAYLDEEHLIFNFDIRDKGKHATVPLADISLIGKHNMINTMSAVLTALTFDVSMDKVIKGLRSFENAAHRLEMVAEIDGVKYINDSKATNVDAVYFALDGIDDPIIWIVGGVDKGNDYASINPLVSKKVRGIICLGTDNRKLEKEYRGKVDLFTTSTSMEEVAAIAHDWAEAGDVVLLSPACASFDLFKNYEDRGLQFKEAVLNLSNTKMMQS